MRVETTSARAKQLGGKELQLRSVPLGEDAQPLAHDLIKSSIFVTIKRKRTNLGSICPQQLFLILDFQKVSMKLVRLSRGISGSLKKAATQLAIENAVDLSAFHLVENDPFASFAQAEVTTRLKHDFELLEKPYSAGGITTKGEAIFVLDDSVSPHQLMGFASYKPRAPAYTFASIVFIAVDQKHRGKGVFRAIITEILRHYPAAGIDCRIDLVPLYERFGFKVEESFGSHILMKTGPLNGKIVHLGSEELMALPAFKSAKQLISAKMGANFSTGLTAFNKQNELAAQAAEAFVLAKKSNPPT